jgi:hypothetical protein
MKQEVRHGVTGSLPRGFKLEAVRVIKECGVPAARSTRIT